MKPFNLEEYLKNPSRKVVTRDGRKVTIHCTNYIGEQHIIAQVEGNDHSFSFYEDGRYANDRTEHHIDLFFAPEKHEGWATIYGKFLDGAIFSTKEEAEEFVKRCGTKDFVAIARIEWEE